MSSCFSRFDKSLELPFFRLSNAVAAARIIMVPVRPGGSQKLRGELSITHEGGGGRRQQARGFSVRASNGTGDQRQSMHRCSAAAYEGGGTALSWRDSDLVAGPGPCDGNLVTK